MNTAPETDQRRLFDRLRFRLYREDRLEIKKARYEHKKARMEFWSKNSDNVLILSIVIVIVAAIVVLVWLGTIASDQHAANYHQDLTECLNSGGSWIREGASGHCMHPGGPSS